MHDQRSPEHRPRRAAVGGTVGATPAYRFGIVGIVVCWTGLLTCQYGCAVRKEPIEITLRYANDSRPIAGANLELSENTIALRRQQVSGVTNEYGTVVLNVPVWSLVRGRLEQNDIGLLAFTFSHPALAGNTDWTRITRPDDVGVEVRVSSTKGDRRNEILLSWDLSQDRAIDNVEWPTESTSDEHVIEAPRRLLLRMSDDAVCDVDVVFVSVLRRGACVSSMAASTRPLSKSEAMRVICEILKGMKCPPNRIENEMNRLSKLTPGNWKAGGERTSVRVGCQLFEMDVGLRPSFDDSRPWCVSIEAAWR